MSWQAGRMNRRLRCWGRTRLRRRQCRWRGRRVPCGRLSREPSRCGRWGHWEPAAHRVNAVVVPAAPKPAAMIRERRTPAASCTVPAGIRWLKVQTPALRKAATAPALAGATQIGSTARCSDLTERVREVVRQLRARRIRELHPRRRTTAGRVERATVSPCAQISRSTWQPPVGTVGIACAVRIRCRPPIGTAGDRANASVTRIQTPNWESCCCASSAAARRSWGRGQCRRGRGCQRRLCCRHSCRGGGR